MLIFCKVPINIALLLIFSSNTLNFVCNRNNICNEKNTFFNNNGLPDVRH